jgi:hypothetical protein
VAALFAGTTAALTDAKVVTAKGSQAVSAAISLRKSGEAQALTANATLALGVDGRCDGPHGVITFAPSVTDLAVPSVPEWLWRPTVLRMVNDKLRAQPPMLCVQGPCKQLATLPVTKAMALPPPMTAAPNNACAPGAAKGRSGR